MYFLLYVNTGDRQLSENFRVKVAQRTGGRFENTFFSIDTDKRHKSMAEVARFLNLSTIPTKGKRAGKKRKPKKDVEKRKLKRELDKLLKSKTKAAKALEDHNNNNNTVEDNFPDGDESQWNDGSNSAKAHKEGLIMPQSDLESFPGIPTHCIPDLLLVWDFFCTFGRTLSLQPIELDDFVAALTFRPADESDKESKAPVAEDGQSDEQEDQLPAQTNIPVYLSECHIALLRLLVKDPTSDLWWWSVLETPEMVEQEDEYRTDKIRKSAITAIVKIDMDALLSVEEDNAVTRKWLQALEDVRSRKPDNSGPIKSAVKSAIAVTTNHHVKTYLKKAMSMWKAKSAVLVKRAVIWLIDRFREARPDLWGRTVSHAEVAQQKKLVAAEAAQEMDIIEDVNIDEGNLNLEGDSDEDSDSEDDDDGSDNEDDYAAVQVPPTSPGKPRAVKENDEFTPVSSFVPLKPVPSIVDMLIPPSKPVMPTDLVHALTWPPVIGAASGRIFQWYKRRRNELDDKVREFRELKPMSVAERRRREMSASVRILSECGSPLDSNTNHVESAISHLCDGYDYLDLNAVQRLCLLRILIEAAYDTHHVQITIEDNFKSKVNATKALDAEERRAKKAAKQDLATLESAARERLATEAKETYIEKKRLDLIEDMKDNEDYTADFIEALNDEDVIELIDDEEKAEYDALPTPASFNKSEVNAVVKMIQEEKAFGVNRLTVLTLEEVEQKDEDYLKSLQDELELLGEADSRETSAKIDRLRQRITKFTDSLQTFAHDRRLAIGSLNDAIQNGTVKNLRNAIKEAKLACLTGDEEGTGGVWVLDLVRDASLELKNAESRKRVNEARKDLQTKADKCFIRKEMIGRDRYQSTFVKFDHDESSRVWAERDFIICNEESTSAPSSNSDAVLLKSAQSASICAPDKLDDFVNPDDRDTPQGKAFLSFARQEYHHSGELATLARHHWSCYTTERSLRVLVKNLDGKIPKENALKESFKKTIEDLVNNSTAHSSEDTEADTSDSNTKSNFLSSGDEQEFSQEKARLAKDDFDLLKDITSAMGRRVRLRRVPDPDRAPDRAEYTMATITGWKMESPSPRIDGEEDETMTSQPQADVPIWRLELDDGGEDNISASETVEGIVRAIKWSTEYPGYVEHDAPFLSYRNSLGRFCGRAVEAPSSLTPQAFAKHLIKREQEYYTNLKSRTFENNWGGKAGARQVWVASLKESGHTFDAVRDGLLTLENAFFELAGGFGTVKEKKEEEEVDESAKKEDDGSSPTNGGTNGAKLSGKDLLYDNDSRFDIELESLTVDVNGLWNNSDAREIYHEIIRTSKTVSILALGLDLICRNATAHINRTTSSAPTPKADTPITYVGRRRAANIAAGAYADFF